MVVMGQSRIPLIGLAAQKAVITFKPLPQGPAVLGRRRGELGVRRQVPFAKREGAVTVIEQDPREKSAALGDAATVTGKTARYLCDDAHPGRMVVPSGQQACARGR